MDISFAGKKKWLTIDSNLDINSLFDYFILIIYVIIFFIQLYLNK